MRGSSGCLRKTLFPKKLLVIYTGHGTNSRQDDHSAFYCSERVASPDLLSCSTILDWVQTSGIESGLVIGDCCNLRISFDEYVASPLTPRKEETQRVPYHPFSFKGFGLLCSASINQCGFGNGSSGSIFVSKLIQLLPREPWDEIIVQIQTPFLVEYEGTSRTQTPTFSGSFSGLT